MSVLKNSAALVAALSFTASVSLSACKGKDQSGGGSATMAGSSTPTGSGSATAAAVAEPLPLPAAAVAGSGSGSARSGSAAAPTDGRTFIDGDFKTPESVLYDADDDLYIVSNINGSPADKDGNGFISKVSPDGKIVDLKWIEGGKNGVKLDAPKGTAIVNSTLYVADITVVRQFDMKTGKQKADIAVPGSTFLNDVAPTADGGVIVSDTGVDAQFQPTGADAVYKIDSKGKLTPLAKDKDLGGPNGVTEFGGQTWVVTFKTGEVYSIDPKTKNKAGVTKPPKGALDGLVALPSGEVYVSSWEGKCVYKESGRDVWNVVVADVEAPADIGYDSKRKKLLIPLFQGNRIVVVDAK